MVLPYEERQKLQIQPINTLFSVTYKEGDKKVKRLMVAFFLYNSVYTIRYNINPCPSSARYYPDH